MIIDKRIDAYIEKSADFAKPILHHLRYNIHKACPQVVETIKWGFPHFLYNNSILCSMAAFKQHCVFGFWKGTSLDDQHQILEQVGRTAMGHLGRITSIAQLPDDAILIQYIQAAMAMSSQAKANPVKKDMAVTKKINIPDFFQAALRQNPDAKKVFEGFNYSNKKDYIEWLTEAKTNITRDKRLSITIEWLKEGKIRNWKYIK